MDPTRPTPIRRALISQGRAADIDILDAGLVTGAGGDGRLERIQVDRHQIDGRDAVGGHGVPVGGQVAARQDAAMDCWMQGLGA